MAVSRFSRPEPESQRLCPVCPGLPMKKIELGDPSRRLLLDYCGRCGGVWFDSGEVDRLRRLGAKAIEATVPISDSAFQKRCGKCSASYDRNADRCPVCNATNDLKCPNCGKLLRVFRAGTTKLDGCVSCRGVWFDNVELKAVWTAAVAEYRARRPNVSATDIAATTMDSFLLASLMMPGPSFGGGIPDAVATAGGDAGAGLLDATGDLAGSVFDKIAEIISGIFDGL